MSEYRLNGLLWAVGLVIAGLLLLLFNLDLVAIDQPGLRVILAGGLAVASLLFFSAFLAARQHWWRLMPAWTLLALAGMVLLGMSARATASGALVLTGLAVAFVHIYLLERAANWWAILPGGFMLVLAMVALSEGMPRSVQGGLLFGGIGVVFALVYLLGDRRRQWWALMPATILMLLGLFVFAGEATGGTELLRWWPLLLIGLGLLVGWQTTRRSPAERLTINSLSSPRNRQREMTPTPASSLSTPAKLGDYSQPAPGATVDILSEE